MRPNWRRLLSGAALVALALVAFGAVPHLHDEAGNGPGNSADGQGDRCVLCHAQDAPLAASGFPAAHPGPAVPAAAVPVAVVRALGMTPTGGGSRAPPA